MNSENNIQTDENQSGSQTREDFMSSFDVNEVDKQSSKGNVQENADDQSVNNFDVFDVEDNKEPQNNNNNGSIDWEVRYREMQSNFDKLQTQNEKNVLDLNTALSSSEFLNQLMDDDEVFDSFVHERKPDLFKKQNAGEVLQTKLKEEFGDFRPTRQEADEDPGGQAWLYYKRLDELYAGTSNAKTPKALKELKAERARAREIQQKEYGKQITQVKTKMGWDDNNLLNFEKWMKSNTIENFAKMYNFALRTQRKMPNITNAPGSTSNQGSLRNQWLKNL